MRVNFSSLGPVKPKMYKDSIDAVGQGQVSGGLNNHRVFAHFLKGTGFGLAVHHR